MGVFDFIRDAGAKIGIGESTAEKEAKEAAEPAAAEAADQAAEDAARAKREAEGRARIEEARKRREAAQPAEDAAAKEAATAKRRERKARMAERKARIGERKAEAKKGRELERYVRKLGLHAEDLEITFDDGTAFIEGTVAGQADKERIILAVGNVAGVAKVDEDLEVVEPEAAAAMYTVVKGDTLSKIAEEHYGDPMKYPVIFEANRPMLTDPDLIYPGQVLRIPALAA